MRRALTVTVAALVMAALVVGSSLIVSSLGDAAVAVLDARSRLALLRDVSEGFELSLRTASLAYVDSYSMSLSTLVPNGSLGPSLSSGLESNLGDLSFSSSYNLTVESESAAVTYGDDGTTLVQLKVAFKVSDSGGDSITESYSVTLHHRLKLLSASSLAVSQHASSLASLSSMGGASLQALSTLNSSYVDQAVGLVIVTRLYAQRLGSVELVTSVSDGGACEALACSYSYTVQLDSDVPLAWSQ